VEADVRAALVRLLAQGKSFKDLTVDELAREAGLSRTAFYFYFPGKSQVLMAAAAEIADEAFGVADQWWSGEGPPEELLRKAVRGNVEVYVRHAPVLRTVVETTYYDPEIRAFYGQAMERFVTAATDHLKRERSAGRLRDLDPEAVAPVLIWMGERCHDVLIGAEHRDPDQVVDALVTVWLHTLYPDPVVAPASASERTVTEQG
jgi:TetR/AcrR family transcriptional regulator, ethionamide resistance regulator